MAMRRLPWFERLGLMVLVAIVADALGRRLDAGDWVGVAVAVLSIALFGSLILYTPEEEAP